MAHARNTMARLALLAACVLPLASAEFDSTSKTNIAVYWGQNSYGQSSSQQRLSYYCSETKIDIIPLAFLVEISTPDVNFANANDNCTTFSGSTLLDCAQLEEDIATCQSTHGKTIMLSVGGATYAEGGFSSSSAALTAAQTVWAMFGPVQPDSSVSRPFGASVVDGFDFDFESTTQNMAAFAGELRALMDAATSAGDKAYYLSAAPQCPYPDAADSDMLDGGGAVSFDFVMVQFYNNYCGVSSYVAGQATQYNFNFGTWDDWARNVSRNPHVKVLLGVPANTGAGSGYVGGSALEEVIEYCETFDSFGGVMMWDMSQLYQNPGFLDQVVSGLGRGSGGGGQPSTTTATASATSSLTTTTTTTTCSESGTTTTTAPTTFTTTSTTTSPTGTAVSQWGQCGGSGYSGSSNCASPYSCVCVSEWWCQCA